MITQNKVFRERIEIILICTTAAISLLIAIVDLSGLLDSNSWIAQRVPSLTLLAVGFVASYLILERQGQLNKLAIDLDESKYTILRRIENSEKHIIRSLDGVDAICFNSSAEMNRYSARRFQKAQKIDHVTWGSKRGNARSQEDSESYLQYAEAIDKFAKKQATVWREVAVFHFSGRFKRIKSRILAKENNTYNVRFYKLPRDAAPNLQGFTLIDKEELLMSHSRSSTWLSIKHPAIVNFFVGYFEDLWQDATVLREGTNIDHQQLNRLEAELGQAQEDLLSTEEN